MTRSITKPIVIVAAAAITILAGLGCGEHELTGVEFVSLSISPDTTPLVAIGESPRLDLRAKDMGGNAVQPKLVHWVSSDPATVEVRQDGTIVALRDGSATISAFVGSTATATTTITVDATVRMAVAITGVSTRPVAPISDSLAFVVYDRATRERLGPP